REFMMDWYLFLDDERYPCDDPRWRIARNVQDAKWYIKKYGLPNHLALDHDLGANTFTGMDFVKWFCDYIMDNSLQLPANFTYHVHSQNPVGKANMESYLAQFLNDGYVP